MPLDSDVEKTGDGIIDAPSGRALRKPVVGDLVAQGKVKMHRVADGILCTDGPSLVIVNDAVPARGSFGDLTHPWQRFTVCPTRIACWICSLPLLRSVVVGA